MNPARLTVVAGHYGSGKTNLAVNYAVFLKKKYPNVAVCDIDIVNPYFRTKDAGYLLDKEGIRLISSDFANTNVELPGIPSEAAAAFESGDMYSVVDLGGDDRGAYALGRYAKFMDGAEMWMVINMYRPLTGSVSEILEIRDEIEAAAGGRFTGLVNNSNLGAGTDVGVVLESVGYAEEVSRVSGLPVIMTSVREDLEAGVSLKVPNVFPMRLITKPGWETG